MTAWWMKFDRILTKRRLTYAYIAGGFLWIAWLISCLLGPGNMDLAGQVVGTDYLPFYSVGTTLREGHSIDLYNFDYQAQVEQSIAGPNLVSYYAFLNPPFLAWLFVPLSTVPYIWSFIIWTALGIVFLWLSIKLLVPIQPFKNFLWSMTWFPIFASFSFGENSLLSLFLFSLTYWLMKKEKYWAAGLVSSILLYKPQLVLGLGILWLLEWRKTWKSLAGLAAGGVVLAGLCFLLLPDASLSYINLVRTTVPSMIYQAQFPLIHLDSLRGFWVLLFPGNKLLVEGLSLVLSIFGVVVFYFYWRKNRQDLVLLYAGAICLTIWITPHAMIYDWAILIIPAILFWYSLDKMRPMLKSVYALLWIAAFISGPLTLAQLKILPVAIQISIPVLFFVFYVCYKSIMLIPIHELDAPG